MRNLAIQLSLATVVLLSLVMLTNTWIHVNHVCHPNGTMRVMNPSPEMFDKVHVYTDLPDLNSACEAVMEDHYVILKNCTRQSANVFVTFTSKSTLSPDGGNQLLVVSCGDEGGGRFLGNFMNYLLTKYVHLNHLVNSYMYPGGTTAKSSVSSDVFLLCFIVHTAVLLYFYEFKKRSAL